MKKHLLFSLDYLPNSGGIARMMSSIRGEFIKAEMNLPVLTAHLGQRRRESGITRLEGGRLVLEMKCLWHLLSNPNDLILCARWYPEGLLAFLSGRNYIIYTHAAELLPLAKKGILNFVREIIKKQVLRKAEKVVANSTFTASLYTGTNSVTIPLAVDPTLFFQTDKEKARKQWNIEAKYVLLTVSRIEEHKGHEQVFRAIKKLPKEIKDDLVYCIAGTGKYTQTLKEKLTHYDIERNVKLLGFIAETNLLSLLNVADIFLLCSTSEIEKRKVEGFGLSLLEAQACGVPVIGNDSGGIPSAVMHNNGGFLLNAEKTIELTSVINQLLIDNQFYQQQSIMARESIETYFNWKRYYNDFNEFVLC